MNTAPQTKPPSPFARRELGILLHPSSLFNREDVGTLGKTAYQFVDWLSSSGVTLWQILPLTPNGQYHSPYFSYSAFAGNPWLIDLELLAEAELLDDPPLYSGHRDHRIPFPDLPRLKLPHLLRAAAAFLSHPDHPWRREFSDFCARETWLDDTCHFFALKEELLDTPWWKWEVALRKREPSAVAESKRALASRLEVYRALFFFFEKQWRDVKQYANQKGVRILGDLPIYVNHDSADVWLHQDQFKLDHQGKLTVKSGVPPDYFSEKGQLWGNPIYEWSRMATDGFTWWIRRLRRCVELTDIVRIDHFRALSAYWEVPGNATDARNGRWVKGPGQAFFDVLRAEFPTLPFVAEDLGTLDEDVHRLRDENGLYGMRILQFGFDGMPDNVHRPHFFPPDSIAYTGTHDNDTVAGWWKSHRWEQRVEIAAYYQISPEDDVGKVTWSLIEAAVACRSNVAIIPMQDLLVLDGRARMNDPASFVDNWGWRLPPDGISEELGASLRQLRDRYRPTVVTAPPAAEEP
ncbi:MAG: 4-alpha-glucanotransferase [Polyangiaceae bacterium]|nr:4-alpha-glucanotransferase [Polyangiaceae bacterium]